MDVVIIMCGIIMWACCLSLHGNLRYLYTSITWNYLAECKVANISNESNGEE